MRKLLSLAIGIWALVLAAILAVQIAILVAFRQSVSTNEVIISSVAYSAVLVLVAYPVSYFLLFHRLLAEIDHSRRTEAMLRASEANYRSIFDAANDAIIIINPTTGAIVDANKK